MDPALRDAAENGDVNFLREAVSLRPPEYFKCRCGKRKSSGVGTVAEGNIFHIAAHHNQEIFLREAWKLLPKDVVKELLFQTDLDFGFIPLHLAPFANHSYDIAKLLLEYYTATDDGCPAEKPWLKVTKFNSTPLHAAIKVKENKENEKCAMLLLSMDAELESCSIVDDAGNSVLFYALKKGYNQVAEKILMSPLSPTSFSTEEVLTPFHLATNCSENVLKLLFKNFVDCIDKTDERGFTVLHLWAEEAEATPYKVFFNLKGDDFAKARTKIFKESLFSKEKILSDTPLHIAARNKQSEVAKILVQGYHQGASASKGESVSVTECPPWNVGNKHGDTPLHLALSATHEELALQILSIDPTSFQILNNKGESPFFIAVASGCDLATVQEILRIVEPRFQMLRRYDKTTVLHSLSACGEQTGRRLLEKYWWMINLRDDSGKSALDYAKHANTPWLVDLLTNRSLIKQEKFDWIEACKREETDAVLAFIDNYQDLQRACREQNDTPLHHIKLPGSQDYLNFLQIPSIADLKNTMDYDGATPLHRALERKDMLLSRILLLDHEVLRDIPNRYGKTAMDLLAKLYRENDDWEKMCKQIEVNPLLKTLYLRPGTNLDQMRNTLSVVAALLATITFAAGFTLPGGIDSNTGNAILAKKAAFLVFLIADVYAMCTSMLVLFCLIWSMISDNNMARVLVDRSVFILMQSLYGTLLAFMTGIYTVISSSSLWAAILIFVMCSIIGISANRTILHYAIAKLIPAGKKDSLRSLEEGSRPSGDASLTGNDTCPLINQSKSTESVIPTN